MNNRQRLLIRSKQQLKAELLMGFKKKTLSNTFHVPQSPPPSVINHQKRQLFLQTNYESNNRSILDQFSKCPIRQDQAVYNIDTFLNKFMHDKNKQQNCIGTTAAKTSVSVQTDVNEKQETENKGLKGRYDGNMGKSPAKVTAFDQRSISNIGKNWNSNQDNAFTQNKNTINQRILSDSLLDNLNKSGKLFSEDSAEQLLRQLSEDSDKFPKQSKCFDEPIVKRVHISWQKNKPKRGQIEVEVSQMGQNENNININIDRDRNRNRNRNNERQEKQRKDQRQSDQKLERLLQKESRIKNMIIGKSSEKQKQKNKVVETDYHSEANYSKWGKTDSHNKIAEVEDDKKIVKNQGNSVKSKYYGQVDPLDLLPAYESSSFLQAVIEQQNQSQLEESVKRDNLKNSKLQVQSSAIAIPKSEIKNRYSGKKQNEVQQHKTSTKKKQEQKYSSSKSIKQISLSDLSLEEVSSIQHISANKKLPDSLKKIRVEKDLTYQLPDYKDSSEDFSQEKEDPKVNIHRYIVNDIASDIKNLQKRISNEGSFDLKDIRHSKVPSKDPQKSFMKGSEGPDHNLASMLDFFDQVHNKLDFGEISKDIIELRNRIENDSITD